MLCDGWRWCSLFDGFRASEEALQELRMSGLADKRAAGDNGVMERVKEYVEALIRSLWMIGGDDAGRAIDVTKKFDS